MIKYLIVLTLFYFDISAQKNAIRFRLFQNVNDNSIYKYFNKNNVIYLYVYENDKAKVLNIDSSLYGFYNNCELPSIDSLKSSGNFYFEVSETDFEVNEEEKDFEENLKYRINNQCAELNIFKSGKDTMMTIYYSSRQQYGTYKKVNTLPKNVIDYLKKNKIKIGKMY